MSDIRLQEIVTRAVVGRGDRRVVWSHTAPAETADCILGVHIGESRLSVVEDDGMTAVRVTVVVDLWLGLGEETRVRRLIVSHTEPAKVKLVARVLGETETRGELVRSVRCVQADVSEDQIVLTLEAEASLETTGLARFWIKAYDLDDELDASSGSDSLQDSSSDSSSDMDRSATNDYEVTETGGETSGMDDLATLAGHEPVPEPLLPAPDLRRSQAVSHFQAPVSKARIVIQGH